MLVGVVAVADEEGSEEHGRHNRMEVVDAGPVEGRKFAFIPHILKKFIISLLHNIAY